MECFLEFQMKTLFQNIKHSCGLKVQKHIWEPEFDCQLRHSETEGQKGLCSTQLVNGFIFGNNQPDVFFLIHMF